METAEHIAALRSEAKLFAEAAGSGGLDTNIDTCPGWDMRDLVRHLSEIHLWAAAHVAQPHAKPWIDDIAELSVFWPDLAVFWPEDDDLVTWYLEVNANLLNALESAPLDVEAFTFLPAPSPLAMWARRQAHETAVHRFDAEHAAGIASRFDAAFAADGIDEVLAAFGPRADEFPIPSTKTMAVRTTDTDDQWHVTISPDGITTTRDAGPADLTIAGDASDVYLAMWNRGDSSNLTITGDRSVLVAWHNGHRVRWSS